MRILFLFIFFASCQSPTQPPPVEAEELPVESVSNLRSAEEPAFDLAYLMGKFEPTEHPDFAEIPQQYADQAGRYLRKEVLEAYIEMYEAAKADGIQLVIRSAVRNFDYQKGIWERKWTGARLVDGMDLSQAMPDPVERAKKILTYSSMPGTSRHHWGTDIDLNDFENSYFESGNGLKVYEWLVANAGNFGFCQVYSEKGSDRPHGYNLEKWHWSYLPVARQLTELAARELTDEMITGFAGAEAAVPIGVVEKYVLGINPACQ
jgi:D-alanyl-D-alanine carboxypeptidase